MSLDWVVNEDTYGADSANAIPAGTIVAQPLTYPRQIVLENITLAANTRFGSGFPEGEKQFIKAVRGHMTFLPDTWALGTTMNMIYRIIVKPMDLATGAAIVDPLYGLNDEFFANERFSWQWHLFDSFVGAEKRCMKEIYCNVNRWLEPDEALYVIMQNLGNVRINNTFYLRTLMRADA